jgi:antitoxin ParD1/3/4
MDVKLSPEQEQFVAEKVKSGAYPSASDVIRDGLNLLQLEEEQKRQHAELRRELMKGIEQLERGEKIVLTDVESARIKAEARQAWEATQGNGHE